MNYVIAITGPAGSGKSAVSHSLVRQIDKGVHINADHIKHFVVSGFYSEKMPDGNTKWKFNQWGIVGESIGLLAKNFIGNDFNVIIDGYIEEPAWDNIEKQVTITQKILLLPELETVQKRDTLRNEDEIMGASAVKEHHEEFSTNGFYKAFTRLDTTHHALQHTVQEILKLIGSK